MDISVLGTAMVGRMITEKLVSLGHSVYMGTRNVQDTIEKKVDVDGDEQSFQAWLNQWHQVQLCSFEDSAARGEFIINAVNGQSSIAALQAAGKKNLDGKIIMDLSNPLELSQGMPPKLTISNTDSLGEQIQSAFPLAKVVKTLNTITATLMVNPNLVGNGDLSVFVSGNDMEAKAFVVSLLTDWFGWQDVIDLGDIKTSRGVEMFLPLWILNYQKLGTAMFGLKIVR